jgi:hypothetical protein
MKTFSKDTQDIEKELMGQLKHKSHKKIHNSIHTYLNSGKLKKALDIIYQLIRDNYCDIYKNIELEVLPQEGQAIHSMNQKLDTIIFLSQHDRSHIKSSLPIVYKATASYNTNTVHLYIATRENEEMKMFVIHRVMSKLFLLIDLFTRNHNTTFNLNIWLSDLKKHKPQGNTKEHTHEHTHKHSHGHMSKRTFRSQHINSGATVHNLLENTVELFIWRKEEIEKVLLHEMIHTLKLDFMNYPEELKQDFIHQFNIPSSIELRLGEAYVETWAVLLNTIFITFTRGNTEKDIIKQCKIPSTEFYYLFSMEIYFTLFQCMKILKHFGYECITGCDTPFKQTGQTDIDLFQQDTSVFSYYLIKSGVLLNLDELLEFCCTKNERLLQFIESPVNFKELHRIFIESAKKNKLLEEMLNLDYKPSKILDNTMRMTLYELDI